MNIKKIAQLADVSIATVSRVVNNKPGVRPAIRAKIEAIIRETEYRPNMMARGLVQQKSNVIGLLIPRFDGYYSVRAEAVLKVCNRNNYGVMIASAVDGDSSDRDSLSLLYEKHIEGLIIFSAYHSTKYKELIRRISDKIPVVFVDQAPEGLDVPAIIQDNYDGARQAMKHLIQCGHRRIAYIGAPEQDREAKKRYDAYMDTLKENEIDITDKYICEGNYSIESGCHEMQKILAQAEPHPTAVFAANDNMAFGAINAIKKHGLDVPENISVVGFDDISMAQHFIPALTTVHQDQEAIGTLAAELLIEYNKNKKFRVKKLILQQELIIRDSVKQIQPETPKAKSSEKSKEKSKKERE